MSVDIVRAVLVLAFSALCGLAAQILVENHRNEMSRRQHAP
ncbi:MAG: hypothetical protein ABR915_09035 [Thermoguttaceae bacterium]|jgi:hypothetical protein